MFLLNSFHLHGPNPYFRLPVYASSEASWSADHLPEWDGFLLRYVKYIGYSNCFSLTLETPNFPSLLSTSPVFPSFPEMILLAPPVAVDPWYMLHDTLHWLFQAILTMLTFAQPLSHVFKFLINVAAISSKQNLHLSLAIGISDCFNT